MLSDTTLDSTRRRLVVGGAVLLTVAVGAGLSGGFGVVRSDSFISSVRTTTTTTLPPTTTSTTTTLQPTNTITTTSTTSSTTTSTTSSTTTSTTSTTTTSTTTTVPTSTTILDSGVPTWEPFEPLPALDGVAALTGQPAGSEITGRPILVAKIDNYSRARPQWGLDQADVIIEENVEGVTRFVALFHTRLPDRIGPVRSARTGDLDIVTSMNRPILAWSGGNSGVTNWIESANRSGILVDFTAQRNPCYNRNSSRSAPHNLQLNPSCAIETATSAGSARQLWEINADWAAPEGSGAVAEDHFSVSMDGVAVDWAWDEAAGKYLRSQNGGRHLAVSGNQIAADNVVEIITAHPPSPVDARSPNPITVGTGAAIIHRNGLSIPATWIRDTAYEPFVFIDRVAGAPIPLDVGSTFVELVRDAPR